MIKSPKTSTSISRKNEKRSLPQVCSTHEILRFIVIMLACVHTLSLCGVYVATHWCWWVYSIVYILYKQFYYHYEYNAVDNVSFNLLHQFFKSHKSNSALNPSITSFIKRNEGCFSPKYLYASK